MLIPGQRQFTGKQIGKLKAAWLAAFEDRALDVGRKERQPGQLAQIGIAQPARVLDR